MADPEILNILRSGASNWNNWRRLKIHGEDLFRSLTYPSSTLSAKPDVGVVDLRGADLSNFDLRRAQLEHCSLEGANLSGANLRRANLSWTCLGEANFRDADLRGATLNGTYASFAKFGGAILSRTILCNSILHIADFTACDLSGADLRDSDLRDAILNGANLSEADLHLAKFIGTKLDGTLMRQSSMGRTIFSGVDLSKVSGLDTVVHSGPSTIGVDTLYLSHGAVPEVSLRGAGIDEALINYLPALLNSSAIDFYSCFISYSHEQKSFARRLHDQLQMRGIRCWLDEHHLLPGDDIYDAVDKGIRFWDKVLLCCSRAALSSWWVGDEIDKALEKERALQEERGAKVFAIIPLNLDNFLFNGWQDGRSATLRKRVAANFVGWEGDNEKFEMSLEKVIQALRTGEASSSRVPPVSKL
jgi:uncharacterized protein YjbI with pentapeptide repeats